MQVESGKTYIGVVEDNEDPKRLGRVKARVLDVFDNTKIEDIPDTFGEKMIEYDLDEDLNENMNKAFHKKFTDFI